MSQCETQTNGKRCEHAATLAVSPIRTCDCPGRVHLICGQCACRMALIENWECFGCGEAMLWGWPVGVSS
jgi:hypothetical protein